MRVLLAVLWLPALALAQPPTVVRNWPESWPIDPAPIESPSWPRLPELDLGAPATPRAARIVDILRQVQSEQRDARYQHRTDVREREARYRWDCSGMVSWVVAHA